jgi:hypothetical protein
MRAGHIEFRHIFKGTVLWKTRATDKENSDTAIMSKIGRIYWPTITNSMKSNVKKAEYSRIKIQ